MHVHSYSTQNILDILVISGACVCYRNSVPNKSSEQYRSTVEKLPFVKLVFPLEDLLTEEFGIKFH